MIVYCSYMFKGSSLLRIRAKYLWTKWYNIWSLASSYMASLPGYGVSRKQGLLWADSLEAKWYTCGFIMLFFFLMFKIFHDFKLGRVGILSIFFLLRILCTFLSLILFPLVWAGKTHLYQMLHYENNICSSYVPWNENPHWNKKTSLKTPLVVTYFKQF